MYLYLSYSVEDLFVMYAVYFLELKWIRKWWHFNRTKTRSCHFL